MISIEPIVPAWAEEAQRLIAISMPIRIKIVLTCDGDHGMFPVTETFEHQDGFIEQMSAAMRAGWKATFVEGARVFLGPCCSGKAKGETE